MYTPITVGKAYGTGSVTAICGPLVSSGTGSPNCAESFWPQAPAVINSCAALNWRPSVVLMLNPSPTFCTSATSVRSSMRAPSLRAARANAGAARRGLA
ncbi:hypothetical protein D3C76_1501640 [compost metagenome]